MIFRSFHIPRLLARFPLLICFAVFSLAICMQGRAIADDDDDPREVYNLKDFDRIEISGIYDIEVQNGLDYKIKLSGSQSALLRASVKVENNTLVLGHKRVRGRKNKKLRGRKSITAFISVPDLRAIHVSGVVDGDVRNINTQNFKVSVSGVGDLKLTGKCGRLDADLSGVGDLNAKALVCKAADVSVSGVGDATVYASQSLNARVSGIGDLDCFGSPKQVRKNRTFFSTIRVH